MPYDVSEYIGFGAYVDVPSKGRMVVTETSTGVLMVVY